MRFASSELETARTPRGIGVTTWREALGAVQENYLQAIEDRRTMARLAHDEGLSYRQIAEGLGLSVNAAHKLVGRRDGRFQQSLEGSLPVAAQSLVRDPETKEER